ncbi:histidine phosphotransferase [Paracoccus sediminis]|jgi:histidine phosphotransferase ChpT|uniref:Histidine phosphotransferase n=1 Tax=Paracoccus sediminis TaxID=1214787 RepID=A0A238X2C1_9RHOB|nr:histidine phosphotransferase family protein [Paracoccus sediminis]TBN49326.1 histidine phosphotransferase [Paracoccus sediminis]SNR52574.1 histidine phosphotransferase ChpT [Paracoccus sediminis]
MIQDTTRIASGELSQLLGSRLCHDLVSPLGAIGNGVELLEMSPDFPGIDASPELKLIAESVSSARARIQIFRVAFGQVQGDQRMSHTGLAQLLDGFSAQGRMQVDLDAQGDFSRAELRMILLAMMCLETAMPWGGKVTILHGAAGWRLVAQADRTKADPSLWAWLGGDGRRSPLPSEVHFPLLAEALADGGRRAAWELDDKGAEIAF